MGIEFLKKVDKKINKMVKKLSAESFANITEDGMTLRNDLLARAFLLKQTKENVESNQT